MIKEFFVELKKNEVIYQLTVHTEFCSWNISKVRSDFLKLNAKLAEPFTGNFSKTFPFWGIRPTESKLAKHEKLVAEYIGFLNSVTSSLSVKDFCDAKKHDVLLVTLDVLKDLRGNSGSEIEIWDMLNSCNEDLILTEKQLHSINCCSTLHDFQIPFMELSRTMENVENLKVILEQSNDQHSYITTPSLDMSSFHSLLALTLDEIDFKGVTELGTLSQTLQHLKIKAGIQDISDILIWVDEENERSPVVWNALETLDLSSNEIEAMDKSLQLLIQLTDLNLSKNKISDIDNIQGLPYLRVVDLSHNNITETPSMHLKMGNITTLNLSNNYIKILHGLERLFSLEDLNLNCNLIDQINQVNRLSRLPQLEALSLSGNPISLDNSYRCDVLALFYDRNMLTLDGEPTSMMETKKLQKISDHRKEVDVHLEESLIFVDMADDMFGESIEEAIVFSEVNLCETHVFRHRSAILVPITEVEDISEENSTEAGCLTRDRVSTIVEVETIVKLDGDNWLGNFMETSDNFVRIPTPVLQILEVTEESLKTLDGPQPKLRKIVSPVEEAESRTTETSSLESKESKNNPRGCVDNTNVKVFQKAEVIPFHIVPNEVYNIDEKIEDLVNRYSSLTFEELQKTYSVYRDGEFLVVGLAPSSKPFKPELLEIRPKGGLITWSIFPNEIESCNLVGDQIFIKKFGDVVPVIYSQLFLHDTAHLYLLVTKMKEIREPEPPEELSKLASDRVFISVVINDTPHENFYSFPSHCFRYCRSEIPIPVVIVVTESEVIIIEVDNFDLLTVNQDMLSLILAEASCQFSVLYQERICNIKQILRSYLQHTVRIEFKEDSNPFGSPKTTFSLLGFNSSDIDIFVENISTNLDNQEISPGDVILTEQESDLRLLKRVLRVQDLQQVKCISVRLEYRYFRCLVMTEHFLFILEEDFTRWPPPCFVRYAPLTPRYSIVNQIRIRFMFGITLYTEIYRGSYVLSLSYYDNLRTFEKDRSDIFISSYENREQLVGHIKRTWRQHYNKEVVVSNVKKHEESMEIGQGIVSLKHGTDFNVENFPSIPVEKQHRFIAEVLNDSYTILYLTKTHCLFSKSHEAEHRCVVIITEENIHVLNHLLPPKLPFVLSGETGSSENRISDHLGLVLSRPVTDISQIVCGIFEQKLRFEFGYDVHGLITFMTRNMQESRELLQAAVEALHCQYQTESYESDNVMITRKGRELSIIHMDEDRLDELRFSIAKHTGIPDYNDVPIINYCLLYQEVLDKKGMITCVLTNTILYLIKEDNLFWPLPQSNQHRIPNSVQFNIVESIPLDDIMCVHYTHFTSCDLVILFENTEIHNGFSRKDSSRVKQERFCLIEAVEKLGKTVTLHTTSLQQRDHLIRMMDQLTSEELPVKKLGM